MLITFLIAMLALVIAVVGSAVLSPANATDGENMGAAQRGAAFSAL